MALILIGEFRLPADRLDEARPAMEKVVRLTRAEPGCLAYAYAPDLGDPCLIRVSEKWVSEEALTAHFAAPHMAEWRQVREGLGLTDRIMVKYTVTGEEPV